MDHFPFDTSGIKGLAAVPAAWHRQQLALEVLRAAWRRRWLIAGVAVLCTAAGLAVASRLAPRYPAETIIELHLGRDTQPLPGGQASPVMVDAASLVQSEVRIVRSRVVARRVVEELALYDDPTFTGEGLMTRLAAQLRTLLGVEGPDAQDAEGQRMMRVATAEAALLDGLSVQTDNRSYLISITYAASQPDIAARIANVVAAAYLAQRIESNLGTVERTAEWLDGQVRATEVQLHAADARVAEFRDRHRVLELGGQGDTLHQMQLREYGGQLAALMRARVADEARLTRATALLVASSAGAVDEFPTHPLVQATSQREIGARRSLSDLQSRFGPRHPSVQHAQATLVDAEAALTAALQQAVAALAAGVETARRTEAEMRERLDAMQVALIGDASQTTQLRHLQATSSALRERLTALARNRDQAEALRDLPMVPASVVVPAQPVAKPSGLNPVIIVVGGLAGGIGLGVVLAVLFDRLDRGFRTSGEVVTATELRCLGLAPELSAADLGAMRSDQPSAAPGVVAFEEAVRLVASSIGLFGAGYPERGRIVLVTSTFQGEGRSTLCTGLARILAMSGRRVLLIDGPPRRFGAVEAERPDATPPGDALVPPREQGSDQESSKPVVLHRGASAGLSVDVFASTRLAAALEQARRHFDVILVEGPPVMLVADALVLGRMADSVIHVAKWADTRRRSVLAALGRMKEHGVAVDGIVLSRVNPRRHARLGLADPNALHLRNSAYYRSGLTMPLRLGAKAARTTTAHSRVAQTEATRARAAAQSRNDSALAEGDA